MVTGYDSLSRLHTVGNPAIQSNPLVTRTYSPNGRLASLAIARSNSVADTTSFAYDGLDRERCLCMAQTRIDFSMLSTRF
jgi:hypothetical protein